MKQILSNYQNYQLDFDQRLCGLFARNKNRFSTLNGLYTFLATEMGCSVATIRRHLTKFNLDGIAGIAKLDRAGIALKKRG